MVSQNFSLYMEPKYNYISYVVPMSLNSNPVMNNVGTGIRNLDYEYDMPMLHGDRFNYLSIISLDNKGIFYILGY